MESDQELDESILSLSQIDYENLEVTDEVGGDDSIEEIIVERKEGFMGSRDENRSEEVEKGSVEKSSKKNEESMKVIKEKEETMKWKWKC